MLHGRRLRIAWADRVPGAFPELRRKRKKKPRCLPEAVPKPSEKQCHIGSEGIAAGEVQLSSEPAPAHGARELSRFWRFARFARFDLVFFCGRGEAPPDLRGPPSLYPGLGAHGCNSERAAACELFFPSSARRRIPLTSPSLRGSSAPRGSAERGGLETVETGVDCGAFS